MHPARAHIVKAALFVILLAVTSLVSLVPVSSTVYNVNAVANPSFEDQLNKWQNYTRHSSPDSSLSVNSTRAIDGTFSARIDMGQASPIGFIGLYQILPFPQNVLKFANISERSDSFDFWFYLEPKFDGMGDFEVRFIALNAREMDYVFDPDPQLSYPNQTFPDGRLMVKSIQVFGYPAGQWHHFTRDLKSDWQAPAKMPSGQFLQGYGLNESLNWLEFDSNGFQDYTGKTYSETAWIDAITVYYDTTSQPPPSPPPPTPPPLPLPQATATTYLVLVVVATALLLTTIGAIAARKRLRNLGSEEQ